MADNNVARYNLHDVPGHRLSWLQRVASQLGFEPAANATIIVSPTALEAASMKEATMPESAAGTITLVATSNRVAPMA